MAKTKRMVPYVIFSSFQPHASSFMADEVSPTIGCTDFGLPRVMEYEEDICEHPSTESEDGVEMQEEPDGLVAR